MADIRPFRGVRFNSVRFGQDVSRLVCPPFDVISPELQAQLYAQDPHNMIRLELTRKDSPEGGDRYAQAAADYAAWLAEGVLSQDDAPALYLYQCRFSVAGMPQQRRGLIAALHLEPWERHIVRPHERVLPGAIEDRIQLMRACRANFSPIWGLYRDHLDTTAALWESASWREPDVRAVDREGAEHAVWRCVDSDLVANLRRALAEEPVYIADGHHRYTTALQYREEIGPAPSSAASNFVMAHLVRSTDPGLPVTGIHRIVRTDGSLDAAKLRKVLAEWFDLEDHSGDAASLFARLQEPLARRPAFGVFSPRLGIIALARLKVDRVPSELAGDHSEAWRTLDAAALHTLAIDRAFAGGTQGLLESGRLTYAYGVEEVERSIQLGASPQTPGQSATSPQPPSQSATSPQPPGQLGASSHPGGETSRGDLALFLAGTPVDQVLAVADAQDRMPEKSTYFYPKPVTGIVFASLSGEVR